MITHAVNSINKDLPVVAMHNTDLGTIFGYHIHSMSLIFRDFQNWPVESMRFNYDNQKWGSPWVFLSRLNESPEPEVALKSALTKAVSDYNRPEEDYFHYGKDAMTRWLSALDEYEALSPEEQDWLYMVNWWSLMHLTDARNQAVKFLQEQRDYTDDNIRSEYDKVLNLYAQEAKLFSDFIQDNSNCVMWWGGSMDRSPWTEPIRTRQKEIMLQAIPLEAEAMEILQKVVNAQ